MMRVQGERKRFRERDERKRQRRCRKVESVRVDGKGSVERKDETRGRSERKRAVDLC